MSYIPLKSGEKIRIGFLFQDATLFPSWQSLYNLLINDKRFDIKVYCTENTEYSYKSLTVISEFLCGKNISYEIISQKKLYEFNPHYMFFQTPYDYMARPFWLYSKTLKNNGIRMVYIPYGIEIVDTPSARRDHFRTPVVNNAYRIYVLSELMKKEYQKYCGNFRSVRATGVPRFDILADEKFSMPKNIIKKANGRKIIVWHAHFAKESMFDGKNQLVTPYFEDYIEFAKKLKEYPNLFFVFMPHPKFGNDLANERFNIMSAKILDILEQTENACIDKSPDYRNIYFSADAIITDRSSLMIEAAVSDVPVLLWYNPDFQETTISALKPLTDTYIKAENYTYVLDFIADIENNTDRNKEQRNKAFKKCIPHYDGKCCERIAEDLYHSIVAEKDVNPKENITIVIFGTGFMADILFENNTFPDYINFEFSDNNQNKWGTLYRNKRIIPPGELINIVFDKIIITVNSTYDTKIFSQLLQLEIPKNKIGFQEDLAEYSEN
jgi:hypothetical protein